MKQENKEEDQLLSHEASSPESNARNSPSDKVPVEAGQEGVVAGPENGSSSFKSDPGFMGAGEREESGSLISDPELLNFLNPMTEAISESTRNRLQSEEMRRILLN